MVNKSFWFNGGKYCGGKDAVGSFSGTPPCICLISMYIDIRRIHKLFGNIYIINDYYQ